MAEATIAQMQAAQGKRDAARSVYEEMIAKDSTSADAQFALTQIGLMQFRAQDYPGAIGTFQRRIALDPGNDEAYYYVGLSHKELNQFPEALDLVSRALRAGHAFTTGLAMVAEEAPEPVAGEFRTLYEQQNLGMPVPEAMRAFADRIPLLDARFFVTAVLTQRENGWRRWI